MDWLGVSDSRVAGIDIGVEDAKLSFPCDCMEETRVWQITCNLQPEANVLSTLVPVSQPERFCHAHISRLSPVSPA